MAKLTAYAAKINKQYFTIHSFLVGRGNHIPLWVYPFHPMYEYPDEKRGRMPLNMHSRKREREGFCLQVLLVDIWLATAAKRMLD